MASKQEQDQDKQQQSQPGEPEVKTQSFTIGMKKDLNATFVGDGIWTHMLNGINNSHDGELGTIGNEQANYKMCDLPYQLIGALHIYKDQWVIFTTDNTNCEIGTFVESTSTYTKIVNSPGLAFNQSNLITGAVKQNFDCTWQVYWEDGINPSRTMNLQNPPYTIAAVSTDACSTVTYTDQLDVEQLRLLPLLVVPQYSVKKGTTGGSLPNGSYQVAIAYTVNEIKVTDYFSPSNVQGLWSHDNLSSSLEVDITSMDPNFQEFELVIISIVNNQTTARRLGIYSTHQSSIYIDNVPASLPAVSLDLIPLQSPAYDHADSMFEVNNYLIRTGVYTTFEFNYQPQALNISANWVAVQYPWDYYIKGGNQVGYMRDEQYAFFIRWIYNTGQKSASYHIPGKPLAPGDTAMITGPDAIELNNGGTTQLWQAYNTAQTTNLNTYTLPDGGIVVASGTMGSWESTELYPTDKPNIWGPLCGQPIRHHKFPDNSTINHHDQGGNNIYVLGVQFSGITLPLDNEGNPITSIVGYEILRGSREGNKTIVAKGLINNMGEYTIPNNLSEKQGLYPNYPYNDLRTDPFLSATTIGGGCGDNGYTPMGSFRRDVFSFHSPDTSFKNPFLSEYELKVHGELSGNVLGAFNIVDHHPRNKLMADFSLIMAGIIGIGEALFTVKGKTTTTQVGPQAFNDAWFVGGFADGASINYGAGAATAGFYATSALISFLGDITGLTALENIFGVNKYTDLTATIAGAGLATAPGVIGARTDVYQESSAMSNVPIVARIFDGFLTFTSYFAKDTDEMLDIFRGFSPHQQYAYQYNSHGLYDTYTSPTIGNIRRNITKGNYIGSHLQDFSTGFTINNLFRGKMVALQLGDVLSDPINADNTRQTIGDQNLFNNPTQQFLTTTSAHYTSLKVSEPGQYGQLENVLQIPIAGSYSAAPAAGAKITSGVLFGGDTYINRFTEKNTFFYFNDWMHGQPDDFEYDYRLRYNVPYARWWMDSQTYDAANLVNALYTLNFSGDAFPSDMAHLDRDQSQCSSKLSFIIKNAYFYLFNNGVRDFFCESEVNLGYRDYGDVETQAIYDPVSNTDLLALFNSNVIKSGNYYKYDYSLSTNKLYQNFVSWGTVLPRWYDPTVAETCWSYYPKRAIYSLPSQTEQIQDNWRVWLVNNYKDFADQITAIHPIAQESAIVFFQNDPPAMFQGIDRLETNAGLKLTIGDGGLFSSPIMSISNSDPSFEYGATQNKYSIVNTPNGLYYISADQGKVLEHGGIRTSYYQQPIQDMSANGMKYWFERYLPYQLLLDFPNFPLIDNTVSGIGCQSTFDNNYEIVYFTKKDYKLMPQFVGQISWYKDNQFLYNGSPITLGDPLFFYDASWTVSLDQKTKTWISYHSWKPDFLLPGKTHFMSVKNNAIWKHNDRCDLFCNYYGTDYPFEVEHVAPTGQQVTTVKSVEYLMEAYLYAQNCTDRNHQYAFNFDQAMLYNSEQHTGLLNLNQAPLNNPIFKLQYPKLQPTYTDIIASKVENKYRFNQFWDATNDRGQIDSNQTQMFATPVNGYEKVVNNAYINYSKSPIQRKALRHQYTRLFLRRRVTGAVKIIYKLANLKFNSSDR
jgi:hypothetical protein